MIREYTVKHIATEGLLVSSKGGYIHNYQHVMRLVRQGKLPHTHKSPLVQLVSQKDIAAYNKRARLLRKLLTY